MEQEQRQGDGAANGWSYTEFVRHNPSGARIVESLLQYAGFFAPARLADRDLAIESGYAAASLAALMHNRILLRGKPGHCAQVDDADQRCSIPRASESGLQQEAKATAEKRASMVAFVEQLRTALAMITHVQIVVEKLSRQHGGQRRRQQAIIYIETLKAISRLLLLACTGDMIVGNGTYTPGGVKTTAQRRSRRKSTPWKEVDLRKHFAGSRAEGAQSARPSSSRSPEVYIGRRSGVKFVVPPRSSVVWSGRGRYTRAGPGRQIAFCDDACAQRRAGMACSVSKRGVGGSGSGEDDSSRLSEGGWDAVPPDDDVVSGRGHRISEDTKGGFSQAWLMAGEVVHILRPLTFSYSCGWSGERRWRPWLLSLGMDVLSHACSVRAGGGGPGMLLPMGCSSSAGAATVAPLLDEGEAEELRRRKLLWLLYLMRSPAFELLAEPVARTAADVFEGVPLLSGMVSYALNMLLYVQRHHFYTSAS